VKTSIVAACSRLASLSEYGSDAAQGEQFEGDRLRRVRSLEGAAEGILDLKTATKNERAHLCDETIVARPSLPAHE
jgi:hypothetical protein